MVLAAFVACIFLNCRIACLLENTKRIAVNGMMKTKLYASRYAILKDELAIRDKKVT